jgi:Bacterial alpha-L-rhamnosidase 6 hairpin glycosidase domain
MESFSVAGSQLAMGASLGNSAVWIQTKGDGAIERIFLNSIGQSLVGTVNVRYAGRPEGAEPFFSGVFAGGPRALEIHPAYQRVRFQIIEVIDIAETTFLPFAKGDPGDDEPLVYVIVELENRDSIPHNLRVVASGVLCGSTAADVRVRYDDGAHALVAYNGSNPQWIRVFGARDVPARFGADCDYARSYDPAFNDTLENDTSATGDVIGRLQWDFSLAPGERRRFWFAIGAYAAGEQDALQRFGRIPSADDALAQTVESLKEILRASRVLTPDPVINQGALWSKVNMRRVMAAYPTGQAFTNDPGSYTNIVTRDAAWFVYGNDHFLPSFSRRLLDNLAERQYSNGKLPEYFDGITGRVEDDGLNINDDTPLYVLAVNHHFRATGDWDWLAKTYPAVARAAHYIISQVDDRGLVYCSADDPRGDVWAIAGWRNIVSGYRISGAVTEINAECVAALRYAAHLAGELGRDDEREAFDSASAKIRDAMDVYLLNPKNGLYYLNIDVDGTPRTDITGDEIFPVIMRACSEETGFRIISRLNSPDFWTPAGLRTVSSLDPRFDPSAHSGLMGGVWPGLTWWYAFGAAQYHPHSMVRALRSSFEHYGIDPQRYNTVPGQFSEWFDGESLANRGMRLSPWEPPRFLWAAVEGLCGLVLLPGAPRVNPLMPSDWNWTALRDVPYHGRPFSYFVVREPESGVRVYATSGVDCDWRTEVYSADVSDDVRMYAKDTIAVALRRDGGLVLLVGNTGAATNYVPFEFADENLLPRCAAVRVYNSERQSWESREAVERSELTAMQFSIERGGFRLLELTAADE